MEEFLGRVYESKRPRLVALALGLMAWCFLYGPLIYYPSMAGRMPDGWVCLTKACEDLHGEENGTFAASDNSDLFPCRETNDGTKFTFELLEKDVDYKWTHSNGKSSFVSDLDLVCSPTKVEMVFSVFFIGGLVGVLSSSLTIDRFGRRRTALACTALIALSSVIGAVYINYQLFLVIRFVQGAAMYAAFAAVNVLLYETFPESKRNTANNLQMSCAASSISLMAGISYAIEQWQHFFWAIAILSLLLMIPLVCSPESPRFYLLKGDMDSTRRILEQLGKWAGIAGVEKVEIQPLDQDPGQEKKASFRQWNCVVFWETIATLFITISYAIPYHTFNFGWATLLPNPYLGYCVNSLFELIGTNLQSFGGATIGRRLTVSLGYFGSTVFVLLSLWDVTLFGKWTVNFVALLISKVFINSTCCAIYLWTAEIPPSTHLGFVFNIMLGSEMLTSFLGTPLVGLLSRQLHPKAPLVMILLFLAAASGVSLTLPETRAVPRVLTLEDAVQRRRDQRNTGLRSCFRKERKQPPSIVVENEVAISDTATVA